ncbi:helix-turn-helix domain-containing protein [Bacillus sp. OK048]|uniref:helix-turn-helix domain-containing protein n=1 Tax=Bacillus sp. OK048 TaxID=1882761 RepID=UPI000B040F68|nr:helix-turn-helix transcriptional regulator [Bacillus sp. OK048]
MNFRAYRAHSNYALSIAVKLKTSIVLMAVNEMALSEKLRKLRDRRNWSQQTLADMMNMDRSTVSRYETGKSIPNYQTVVRFAELYQVEKEYLVEELNQLLPKVDEPGYITKESLEDHDLGIILQLLQQEPDLKKNLLDLYLMSPKRRAFFVDLLTYQIKASKRHKNI